MATADQPVCARCGSDHIIAGHVDSQSMLEPAFMPDDTRFFVLSFSSPAVTIVHPAYVCLRCGLLWTEVDVAEIYKKIETWGSEALQERTRSWQQSSDVLLRPSELDPEKDPAQLLRTAPPPEEPSEG